MHVLILQASQNPQTGSFCLRADSEAISHDETHVEGSQVFKPQPHNMHFESFLKRILKVFEGLQVLRPRSPTILIEKIMAWGEARPGALAARKCTCSLHSWGQSWPLPCLTFPFKVNQSTPDPFTHLRASRTAFAPPDPEPSKRA